MWNQHMGFDIHVNSPPDHLISYTQVQAKQSHTQLNHDYLFT